MDRYTDDDMNVLTYTSKQIYKKSFVSLFHIVLFAAHL